MAEDSCSYYQEKNKECGSYPTCKKTSSLNNSPGKKIFRPLYSLIISMLFVIKISPFNYYYYWGTMNFCGEKNQNQKIYSCTNLSIGYKCYEIHSRTLHTNARNTTNQRFNNIIQSKPGIRFHQQKQKKNTNSTINWIACHARNKKSFVFAKSKLPSRSTHPHKNIHLVMKWK